MKTRRIIQAATFTGAALFAMAASASASTITFNTTTGSGFSIGGNVLSQASGAAATITFGPNPAASVSAFPSNVNFGDFTVVCATCTTAAVGTTSTTFGAFTFNLFVNDTTDGAVGKFVGTSSGGVVWADVNPIVVTWVPLILGPGTTNATSGNFALTIFTTTSFTPLIGPNNGTPLGFTTIQGIIDQSVPPSAVPEPATLSLVGGALLGIGLLRRRILPRQ